MRKKLFTFFLAMVASVGTLFAESGTCGENLTWDLTDGVLTISGTGAMENFSSFNDYTRAPWYQINESIKTVIINDGVTTIGTYAFHGCSSMTSIEIPNSVTSIGSDAFYGCSSLSSINIPDNITNISNSTFFGCTSLTNVTLPNNLARIGSSAFGSCTSLTSLMIPYNVTYIGYGAFEDVPNVIYYGSATGSPWNACNLNCYGEGWLVYDSEAKNQVLKCASCAQGSITIPSSVTKIGNKAFSACGNILGVTLQEGVQEIGVSAFYKCKSLQTVIIQEGLTTIGASAFSECENLTSVTLPNSLASIGSSAFSDCYALSATVPTKVKVDSWAFYNAVNIIYHGTDSSAPWGARSLNGYADGYLVYKDATKKELLACSPVAQDVIIPNSVTEIGRYAFYKCANISEVTIPSGVTEIAIGTFGYCSGLSSITLPSTITSIDRDAFVDCGRPDVHISDLTAWCNINFKALWSSNPLSHAKHFYLNGNEITDLIIPSDVSAINKYAFSDFEGLKSVTIPNSVIKIGDYAFSSCDSLSIVTLGNNVSEIADRAFSECSKLTSIAIPNSVTSIGSSAFAYCYGLTSVHISDLAAWCKISFGNDDANPLSYAHNLYLDGALITDLVIPNNTTSVGNYTFSRCSSLASVIIPNSITSIGNYAFQNCSGLKYVIASPDVPPTIGDKTFSNINTNTLFYVANLKAFQEAQYWSKLNLLAFINVDTSEKSTSAVINFTHNLWKQDNKYIVSIGLEGGEQQTGNVLDYIGLEPNSEYKDIPVVLTANTGETETVNVSFSTTALELTTKPSKVVSSTTAILLAETNMSDAEVSCGFEYKRNDAPADMDGTKVFCPVASGQMAGRLKGLKDDVYYKYRAFYQSAAGNMYYGDWQYIFTGDVAVEFDPILYTYGATVVKENEATISGYALAGSEDFTEQGFEYWAESRANNSTNAPRRMPAGLNEHFFVQASGIALHATLTNLDAGTVYKYRVYGKVGDQYYYGSEQSFTTQGTYEGDDSEAIEEVPSSQVQSTKILRDGQIYILRGEKVYTITGLEAR